MKKNFRGVLQYEGTRYQGWQRQTTTLNTIQGKLEAILSKMTGEQEEVTGSGRTDAGVHAFGQVINFRINTEISAHRLMEEINSYLPEDIALISLEEASPRFHARLNATGKEYRYRVLNSSIPRVFDRRYVYRLPEKLDVKAMREGVSYLLGKHDFKAFTSKKKTKKSTVRTIYDIKIEEKEDELIFTFSGDGFLYHMVRIMMGTLLEIGLHKREPESIPLLFAGGKREDAGFLAPAQGLALMKVYYS